MTTKTRPAADTPALIDTGQMRRLHALLRDHGVSGDKAVHDYINRALEEAGQPPVESRKDLPAEAADRIIADLETAEVAQTAVEAGLARLRAPFPAEAIGKLPRSTCKDCSDNRGTCSRHPSKNRCQVCGNYHSDSTMHIDYVGHADVTARLLEVDPHWTWRPFTGEELAAIPPAFRDGLWIMLTVLGVTRPGYGDADGKRGGNAVKEAIGDALRNGGMRFGVALDLWAKGDRDWSRAEKSGAEHAHPDSAPPRQQQPGNAWQGPSTADLLLQIDADAARAGVTYEQATAKFRERHGGLDLNGLDTLDPWLVAPLAEAVRKRADEVAAEKAAAERAEAEKAAAAETPAGDPETPEPGGPDDPWATPSPGASGEQPPA